MLDSLADSQPHPSPVNEAPGANSKAWAMPRFRLGVLEIVTLCIYAGLIAWAIPHHEPWADEAQAWQIARTLALGADFSRAVVRGSPGALVHLPVGVVAAARELRRHALGSGGNWIFGCSGPGDHFTLSPLHQTAAAVHVLPGLPIRNCGAQLRVGAAVDFSLRILLATKAGKTVDDRLVPGTSGQCRSPCRRDLGWLCHHLSHRPMVEPPRTMPASAC